MCDHLVIVIILWWLEGSVCSHTYSAPSSDVLPLFNTSLSLKHLQGGAEKKSCTITASASRQQSGYEPSPLSQPSVYCWVLCSDECYTYMRTSGMCLYNRVKHTTSEFEVEMLWKYLLCFSILCWPSEASDLVSAHKPPTDHHWPSDARVHRFLSVCWTQSLIHKFPNC